MLFKIDQLAIDYQPQPGNKRPFIFIHGNTQNDTCGKGLKDYFIQKGHSVLSFDLPGHGDSLLNLENYHFDDLVALNHQLIQHYHLEHPILCGHSFGGMIQAATIARFQLADTSLILCGSLDSNPVEAAKKQMLSEAAIAIDLGLAQYIADGFKLFKRQKKYDYFSNRQVEDEIINIINRRNTHPLASQINMQTLPGFDVRQQLIDLAVPVLVLHGQKEDIIPPTLIESMVKEYQKIHLCWYPNSGHNAFYQQAQLTELFLEKHYDFIND